MKRFLFTTSALVVGLSLGIASAQVLTRKAEGYLPQVTLIKANVPDGAQVCAEVEGTDRVDCRSVGELRKWLRERIMK